MQKHEVRILQVCNTDFYLSKFLLPLVLALKDSGYTVECLTEGTSATAEFAALGIKVHHFEFPRKGSPAQFVRAIRKMRLFLDVGGFHVVNGHNRNSSIVSRCAAALAGVPVNLYTAHGFYFQDNQSWVSYRLTEVFERMLAHITTHTLSQSDEDTRYVTRKGWIDPQRIQTIGNGVDTDRFNPEGPLPDGEKSAKFRICAVGRMVAGKGFEDILRALSRSQHRDCIEMVFIGGNIKQDIAPSAGAFQALIDTLGLGSQIHVTGMVDNVEAYLRSADLFIHPSYAEGMPRSLLEAMSTALPCIATRIRGAREIIDGDNGLLYEPHDCVALAGLIDRLFEDEETRASMGRKARASVVGRFRQEDYLLRQVTAIDTLVMAHAR